MSIRFGRHVFFGLLVVSTCAMLTPGGAVPTQGLDDKVMHGLVFLALAVTGRWAGYAALPLAVALVGYAGLTEVLQTVLPINRDGDPRDLVADGIGIVIGLVLVELAAWRGGPPGSPPAPRRSRSRA